MILPLFGQHKSRMHQLRILSRHQEALDAVRFVFDKPTSPFDYQPGQYITMLVNMDGEKVQRAYSLYTLPTETHLGIVVRQLPNGKVSQYVAEHWQVGQSIDILPPAGNFTPTLPDHMVPKNVFLWAGGSGITPLFSIMQHLLQQHNSHVHLIYANRTPNTTILRKPCENLTKQYPDKFSLTHLLSNPPKNWTSPTGRLTPDRVRHLVQQEKVQPKHQAHFLCGPEPMMRCIETTLYEIGIPTQLVKKEHFVLSQNPSTQNLPVQPERKVHILFQQQTHQINVPPTQSILESALEHNIPLPHSCTNGLCATCKVKLKQGTMAMTQQEALSPEELAQDYRLTCVGHPTSDNVVIEVP